MPFLGNIYRSQVITKDHGRKKFQVWESNTKGKWRNNVIGRVKWGGGSWGNMADDVNGGVKNTNGL